MENLFDLKVGQSAFVEKILSNKSMLRRFLDIGLVNKTYVECVGQSPAGDPKAFLIRGAVVALRSEDCKNVLINKGG